MHIQMDSYSETPFLQKRIEEAVAREAVRQHERNALLQQGDPPPQPGDVYCLQENEFDWLLLERDPKQPRVFRAIPLDNNPLAGSCDIRLPPEALVAASSARCAHQLLIHEEEIAQVLTHAGRMAPRHFVRVLGKMAQIAEAQRTGKSVPATVRQYAIDLDPDYRDWIPQIRTAITALEQLFGERCPATPDPHHLKFSDFLPIDCSLDIHPIDRLLPWFEFGWRFDLNKRLRIAFNLIRGNATVERSPISSDWPLGNTTLTIDVGEGESLPSKPIALYLGKRLSNEVVARIADAFTLPEEYAHWASRERAPTLSARLANGIDKMLAIMYQSRLWQAALRMDQTLREKRQMAREILNDQEQKIWDDLQAVVAEFMPGNFAILSPIQGTQSSESTPDAASPNWVLTAPLSNIDVSFAEETLDNPNKKAFTVLWKEGFRPSSHPHVNVIREDKPLSGKTIWTEWTEHHTGLEFSADSSELSEIFTLHWDWDQETNFLKLKLG